MDKTGLSEPLSGAIARLGKALEERRARDDRQTKSESQEAADLSAQMVQIKEEKAVLERDLAAAQARERAIRSRLDSAIQRVDAALGES